MKGEALHDVYRAQVDTAAETTVTPYLYLLHKYRIYSEFFWFPIFLVAALDSNADVLPFERDSYTFPVKTKIVVPV